MARVLALRTLHPNGGEEDTDDGDVAVDGDDGRAVEEVGVEEDDEDLRDVEEDGEDEVGDRDVVERPYALRPRVFKFESEVKVLVEGSYECGVETYS